MESDIDFNTTAWIAVERYAKECMLEWTVEILSPGVDVTRTELLRGKIAAFQQLIDLSDKQDQPRTKPHI